jgi:hypothetical protein
LWLDSSAQRFCLAADRVSEFAGDDAADGIEFAFETLDVVAGQRFSEHTSQWSLVFDTGELRAYFRTHLDPTLRWVDLDERFLWCNRPVQMLDIHDPVAGDAGPMFHDFSHAEARDQLLWFIDFWWGVDATPAGITAFLNHCEDFACGRPTMRRPGHRVRPVAK